MEIFDVLKQGSRDIEYLLDAGTGDVWIGANEVLLGGFVPAVVQRLAGTRPDRTDTLLRVSVYPVPCPGLRLSASESIGRATISDTE